MRIISIDTFRVFAILAVIGIHAFAFWLYPKTYDWVQLLNRFAVPFFFITSGYFFTLRALAGKDPTSMAVASAKRLALIFFVWSCVYALAPAFIPKNWANVAQNGWSAELFKQLQLSFSDFSQRPVFNLFQGPGFHLWYLPALICCQLLLGVSLRFKQLPSFMLLALALFIFALLAKPYANTAWGIRIAFDARNGPFFGSIFVAMGAWLAYKNFKPGWKMAMAVLLLGYGLQFWEGQYLHHLNPAMPVAGNDFLVGTVFLGLGVMLVALALPTLGASTKIYKLAPYGLGIYVIHILVRDFLEPIHSSLPFYAVTWTLATFIVSLGLIFLLNKIAFIRATIS